MIVVIGENRFRFVAETEEQVNVPGCTQHGTGIELMGVGRDPFDFAYQCFPYSLTLVGGIHG